MLRSPRLLRFVLPVVLVGLVAAGSGATLAQDATPAAGPPEQEVGITFTPLGFAPGFAVPSPADLILVRASLEPGVASPFAAADPAGGMLVVESGVFTARVDDLDWTVTRGQLLQEAMASPDGDMGAATETIAMGEDATLEAGDVANIPGGVNGEIRNDGDEPAVGLLFLIAPSMTGQ